MRTGKRNFKVPSSVSLWSIVNFHLGIFCTALVIICTVVALYCFVLCGFCNVWVCVCVCVCGFCNMCVCVCVGFVMCGCVYAWVL